MSKKRALEPAEPRVDHRRVDLHSSISQRARMRLAALPTPLLPLAQLTRELDGPELWIKRDDLTGLAGGGNKTRKLEFLVGEALQEDADTLVTVGAIQSNHTRQTAAPAARAGLGCVLLHNGWASEPGPSYRNVGNPLISDLLGARMILDNTRRPLGSRGKLRSLVEELRKQGLRPYEIPRGGSDHSVGGMGYALCAAEIAAQITELDLEIDFILHCTGSSSTQAGLLAGFAALGVPIAVIGVSDDNDSQTKRDRVLRLANETLTTLGSAASVSSGDVEVVVADSSPYGSMSADVLGAMQLLARTEGLIADPVYEGRTILGLRKLIAEGCLQRGQRGVVMHLGGNPAIHAYAEDIGGGMLFTQMPEELT